MAVFVEVHDWAREHDCVTYMRDAIRTRDGRKAFMGIWNHYLGVNNVDNMSSAEWRSLVHHCIDHSLLNVGQFGGLPGRDAMTPVFLEELQWETTRASRRSLMRMDFDASSCYDRIIPSIASLAARSFGQHKALCFIHATFLQQAKYVLKTKLGLSDEGFSHCQLHPIYGTGQGSANSPVIWVLISSRLFDAHAARAYGATFFSPDRSLQLQIFMIGFVDDSNACVNDFVNSNQSPEILLQRAHSRCSTLERPPVSLRWCP